MAAYKTHGFFYDQKSYDENSFGWEDIFTNATVEKLKNTSMYFTQVTS